MRFLKLIFNPVSATVALTLAAAGLLVAVHRANAATTVSTADNDFMVAAAQDGMTEVQLGHLAYEKGMTVAIKEFGQRMVKDHTSINDELKALAAQKNVGLPDRLDVEHRWMVDRLANQEPLAFDDAYLAAMIKDHNKAITAFKAESTGTRDMDIKSFVDRVIPVLEDHRKSINDLKK